MPPKTCMAGGFLRVSSINGLFTFCVKSIHVELVCSGHPRRPRAKQESQNPMSSRFLPILAVAVALLHKLGYQVAASTGRAETHGYLKGLGATTLIDRQEIAEPSGRPQRLRRQAST